VTLVTLYSAIDMTFIYSTVIIDSFMLLYSSKHDAAAILMI